MIVNAFIELISAIVSGVLSLVPDWTVDVTALAAVGGSIGSTASTLNGYFPVATVGVVLVLLLALQVGLLLWRVVIFVYNLIPFV